MLDWVLLFARDLALVIWLGGLIVIDFVEAPAKFRTPGINRNQAVAVGRQVFAAVNRMEVAVGVLLLAADALLMSRVRSTSSGERAAIACAAVMWLIALVQNFGVRPRLTALSTALDLVNRAAGDARYTAIKRLHLLYVTLDVCKIALGLVTLAIWSGERLPTRAWVPS